MSYEIEYSDTESPATIQQALHDCEQWLGNAQFKKVCEILQADNGQTPRHLVRFGLMMQGIQGYPAEAMIDKYWSPQMVLDL
jgi:hypothetical protein